MVASPTNPHGRGLDVARPYRATDDLNGIFGVMRLIGLHVVETDLRESGQHHTYPHTHRYAEVGKNWLKIGRGKGGADSPHSNRPARGT